MECEMCHCGASTDSGARVSAPAASSEYASPVDLSGSPELGTLLRVWRRAVRRWVKTHTDRRISFRLDTKVVPEYPVKA